MKQQVRPRSGARSALGWTVLAAFVAGVIGTARGQVAPQSAVHTTSGPGTAGASVTATGGFPASVPLDLPGPRRGLPVPLGVVYNGGTAAGVAGAGWDVPLSYVRRSDVPWRRKPEFAAFGAEAATPRMTVSIGGGEQLMVPRGDVFVPFAANEYTELRQDGATWRLRTLANVEYVFSPLSAVTTWQGDPDLWLLTEIRDLTGTDRVVLRYGTAGCNNAPELTLAGLSYGFDASGDVPLYEVTLKHRSWGAQACLAFGAVHDHGLHFWRSLLLDRIVVEARNNLAPQEGLRELRGWTFSYETDRDLGMPRLTAVTMSGERGSDVHEVPVATYAYGTLSHPRRAARRAP